MERIQIQSDFSASTEGFRNEPSPQDAERLLYEPLLASPNPSMLTADGMLSCSQRTHDLDPANFFENTKCSGTPLGACNTVSFDAFTFDENDVPFNENDVPFLGEEVLDPSGIIGGNSTPLKRARCQDKLEAMKLRRTTTRRTKQPPKKDKKKMKEYAETMEHSEDVPDLLIEKTERSSFDTVEALGWCKCKHSRCLKLYCDCFRNEKPCGLECKCKKCQNT